MNDHQAGSEGGKLVELTKEIGRRIRIQRESLLYTQEELGKECGLTCHNISHFECGRRAPNVLTLGKLSRALRISSDWLLGLKPR